MVGIKRILHFYLELYNTIILLAIIIRNLLITIKLTVTVLAINVTVEKSAEINWYTNNIVTSIEHAEIPSSLIYWNLKF